MLDETGTLRKWKDGISDGITWVSDKLGYNPDTQWRDRMNEFVDDVIINTQPYNPAFGEDQKVNKKMSSNYVKGPGGLRPTADLQTDLDGSKWDTFA